MKLAFVCNEVAGGWTPTDFDALGGGEEALVQLARALVRVGHEVIVFYQGKPVMDHGASYRHYSEAGKHSLSFDVAVYRKSSDKIGLKLSHRNIFWNDQAIQFDPKPFERVVVASNFMSRVLSQITPSCAHLLTVVREGTDVEMHPEAAPRNPKHVLYTSSPDRGLKELLTIWPRVLDVHPDARLTVTYGWSHFDRFGGNPALKEEIIALANTAGPSVEFTGRLSYRDTFALYAEAGVWAYPCNGGEFYCHSAVRAQLGGCIPVVLPWGALSETVWSGAKAQTLDEFADALIASLYPEQQIREEVTIHGKKLVTAMPTSDGVAIILSWDDVATTWETEILAGPPDALGEASHLGMIPPSPPFDVPLEATVAPRVWPVLAQWLESVHARRPYLDESLGVRLYQADPVTKASDGDAVILGYAIEDHKLGDVGAFAGIAEGTPMAVLISHGNYRAEKRQRVLTRRDIAELFGKQPELTLRGLPLDNEGNAITIATFRFNSSLLGKRDMQRVARTLGPRQTLSACFITKDAADTIGNTLRSLVGLVDEICILDNGSTDDTLDEIDRFVKASGVPTKVQTNGYTPRYCFDCLRVHDVGEVQPGHRVAGFETPRNQSIAMAQGDWIMWLDADEKLVNGKALSKYLRHNSFEGYCIQQHHFSVDPPQAAKVDLPVRIFRRKVDPNFSEVGLVKYGPLDWPTYHSGLTVRFGGLVHEHPGFAPTYGEGLGPVIILSDCWIAHSGYYTELARRKRFVRNRPLMVADRLKYPERRLGKFLWIRDLTHQMRYILEQTGGRRTPEVDMFAHESLAIWRSCFIDSADPFTPEALSYVRAAQQVLGRGVEVRINFSACKPEVGEEREEWAIEGRFENRQQVEKAIVARLGGLDRWEEPYI